MTVVVTGGAGKLGQWVVRELIAAEAGIAPRAVRVFDQARGAELPNVHYLLGDIRDLGQVVEALSGAEAVIHLAGIPTHSVATNEVTFRTNVMGTFNVFEAAARLGIKRVVTMSSEAVLGWAPGAWEREVVPHYLPIDEDHPTGAQDSYGLSKEACETVARSYTLKYGLETVVFRPPWFVSPEELETLRRSGGRTAAKFALFNYIDVRDLAELCRLAIERPVTGYHVLFVGAGESVVGEPLCSLYPRLMPALGDKAAGLTGTRSSVSIERVRKLLGWTPRHSWRTTP